MANTIQVDIVSAEEQIFSGEAYMVYAPAVMGEVGIAPRHTPLISPLKPGEVRLDRQLRILLLGDEQSRPGQIEFRLGTPGLCGQRRPWSWNGSSHGWGAQVFATWL